MKKFVLLFLLLSFCSSGNEENIEEAEVQIETTPKASSKKSKLILSIIFDAIGMLSYVVPVLAEVTDIVWAPVAGLLLTAMFKGTTGKI